MQLATYGSYGICLVITLILLIIIAYVRGSGFVTNLVFYLLLAVSFLSGDKFALTDDGGGKKSTFFYVFIPLIIVLTLMGLAAILFGMYLLIGQAILKMSAT
jgi:hypothetical protein